MRALEFITGHVIYKMAYTYKFQLKTTNVSEYKSSTNTFLEWKEAKSDQWQHCFLVNFISDRLCLILKLLL